MSHEDEFEYKNLHSKSEMKRHKAMDDQLKLEILAAEKILEEYVQPNSGVDMGNLFFAATTLQRGYRRLVKKHDDLVSILKPMQDLFKQVEPEMSALHEKIKTLEAELQAQKGASV